jgi:hypothetical protein
LLHAALGLRLVPAGVTLCAWRVWRCWWRCSPLACRVAVMCFCVGGRLLPAAPAPSGNVALLGAVVRMPWGPAAPSWCRPCCLWAHACMRPCARSVYFVAPPCGALPRVPAVRRGRGCGLPRTRACCARDPEGPNTCNILSLSSQGSTLATARAPPSYQLVPHAAAAAAAPRPSPAPQRTTV